MVSIHSQAYLPMQEFRPHTFKPSLAKRIFDKLDQTWGYLGKTVLLTRQALNATLKTCHHISLCCSTSAKIQKVIAKLKLLSIVGVPFTLNSIHSTTERIFKSLHTRDDAGVFFGSLSLVILATDAVDSLATFTNAVLNLVEKAPIAFLSDIGMPLAFSLTTLGSFSRTLQLVNTHRLYQKVQGDFANKQDFKIFLIEKLGATDSELSLFQLTPSEVKEKELKKLLSNKRAALLRQAPAAVVDQLEKLAAKLSDPSLTHQEIKLGLVKISALLRKKMRVDGGNLAASMLSFLALCLFFTTAPAMLPFLILATSLLVRLGFLAYQDFR